MTGLVPFFVVLVISTLLSPVQVHVLAGATSYPNAFVDPRFILDRGRWNPASAEAQDAIVAGARQLALQGPWSVLQKDYTAPATGNIHDYLSFAPYYWPDCSKAGNTTALQPQEVWDKCVYVDRDGQFVPDQHIVNDAGHFVALGDAVFYNAMAWSMTRKGTYASNINTWIKTWFVDQNSAQTPNLANAQVVRGVGMNVGTSTGILDFRGMAKIATGIETLRLGHAAGWTQEVDDGFKTWLTSYLSWLKNSTMGIAERELGNNHGTFYINQEAAIHVILQDTPAAIAALDSFFSGVFKGQIDASGEQPLEAKRADPVHYRAYNLAALITNGQIADYLNHTIWNRTTKAGGTIQKATDWAMEQSQYAYKSNETPTAVGELDQIVARMATVFGDPSGKYKAWLKGVSPSEAFLFWDYHATASSTASAGLHSPTHFGSAESTVGLDATSAMLGAVGLALGSLLL